MQVLSRGHLTWEKEKRELDIVEWCWRYPLSDFRLRWEMALWIVSDILRFCKLLTDTGKHDTHFRCGSPM